MIIILIPFFIILLPPSIFFLYLTLTEYKPKDVEEGIIYRKLQDKEYSPTLSISTFNIGYCALDKDRIKLGDHIKKSKRSFRDKTYDNMIAVTNTIKKLDTDFTLLQEVDIDSSRSDNTNQIEYITSEVKEYNATFAFNYNAKFVPFPLNNPVGSTHSGLLNLSKHKFTKTERYQLEGQEKWPKSMFFLKRCLLINEYDLPRNKKLIIINVHLSSYDKSELFRTQQFHDLLEYVSFIYDGKKNYIVIGGDFNFLMDKSMFNEDTPSWLKPFPEELFESKFKPVFDSKKNTMINSDGFETNIDGFIVSQNVKVVKCTTVNEKFEHSNHNPVKLTFKVSNK